ncbi:MAG: hypothetical protein AB7P33_00870 [Dehalococcoidia bacterium]
MKLLGVVVMQEHIRKVVHAVVSLVLLGDVLAELMDVAVDGVYAATPLVQVESRVFRDVLFHTSSLVPRLPQNEGRMTHPGEAEMHVPGRIA